MNFTTPCIAFILDGEKQIFADNKYDKFSKGDVVLLRPGNYLTYEVFDDVQNYKSLLIFFDPSETAAALKNEKLSADKFEIHSTDDYLDNFTQSCKLLFQDEILKTNEALHVVKLRELFAYIESKHKNWLSFFQQTHASVEDENFRACMERYSSTSLSLAEIAFLCNMSLSSFKRTFMKLYKTSPGKWFQQKRLQHAAVQIRSSGKDLKEVSFESGYADYSSFSNSFKKQFGVSPRAYRCFS